jgi:hypothetical protein
MSCDALELAPRPFFAQEIFLLSKRAKGASGSSVLAPGRTHYLRAVRKGPGPCHRRAVFISYNLAVQGSPCTRAPDGQGTMVAPVPSRRQSHILGSSD